MDKGWVTEASVEDVKLLPGVHRTMFRLQGGEWVAREIVKDVHTGRAEFVVNSGDVVWWGNQGLYGQRQPVLEARQRHHVEATAAPGQRDARGRARRSVVHRRGQSRGVGRSQDRGRCLPCRI